jgi:hypothetical protein
LFAATVCRKFEATRQTRGKNFVPCAAILPRIYCDPIREFTATISRPIAAIFSASLQQTWSHILPRPYPRVYRDVCRIYYRELSRTYFCKFNMKIYRGYLRYGCHTYCRAQHLHFFIGIATHLLRAFPHLFPGLIQLVFP